MSNMEGALRYAPSLLISTDCSAKPYKAIKPLSLYNVFWMFVFGSFIGYVVETLYCLAKTGIFENRSSMLFGPFNIIYGIGALALYIGLHKISNIPCVLLLGMVSGSVIEFIASWFQQTVFGSVSWDYSSLPLNIGGRISLLFALFWGVLAVLWVKCLQPLFERLILFTPKRIKKQITVCLIIFFVLNIAISIIAVARWEARLDGIPAANTLAVWIDGLFPDTFMEWVYANMMHIK